MSTPKENVVPPGGFHFVENGVTIESHSYQALADALLSYRLDNKIPVGNPLKDVLDAVCNKYPHFCTEASVPSLPMGAGQPSIASQVAQWMASLYRSTRSMNIAENFVDQNEADRRSAICRTCPNNVEWRQGCHSCIESAKQIGFTYRAGRKAAGQANLLACGITKQENATAVWVKAPPSITPEEATHLPFFCWRK